MTLLIILLTTALIFSFLFMTLTHPLAMGLTLIAQTLLICAISSLHSSPWYSYILFIIFMGAMLVLFLYVVTLASNETFSLSMKLLISMTTLMTLISMITFFIDPLSSPIKQLSESSALSSYNFNNSMQSPLSEIYNMTSATLTTFIILYLLLTLIVTVKLTTAKSGPLRKS